MSQFRITYVSPADKRIWFVLETAHPDMAALAAELSANGLVVGTRIDVDSIEPSRKRERKRGPIVIAKSRFVIIEPLNFELLPPEPVA